MAEGGSDVPQIKLKWMKADTAAPCPLDSTRGIWDSTYGHAICDGHMVYFYKMGDKIRAYDMKTNQWAFLPSPERNDYSLAIVQNKLTAIGGGYFLNYTNKLFTLSGEGDDLVWREDFRPMPTKRSLAIALTTETSLIVAGGKKTGSIFGDTDTHAVEVMNMETLQWSVASPFPTIVYDSTAVLHRGQIYIAAMREWDETKGWRALLPTRKVYTCSVGDLLQSCSRPVLAYLSSALWLPAKSVWKRVADLPVTETTCVVMNDLLLAIGGRDSEGDATTAVRMYDRLSDSWTVIGHMTTARLKCFAAVVPDNQLMVVGGHTNEEVVGTVDKKSELIVTSSIEFATVE